jgi:Glucose / Sorbosone dehydrogenase
MQDVVVRARLFAGLLLMAGALVIPAPAGAATLDPIGTYSAPMDVRSDPSDPDRLFVAEREGRIQKTEDGETTLYLDQTAITSTTGERGLLSFEPAPDFAASGRYYVYYAGNGQGGTNDGTLYVDELISTGDPDNPVRNNVISIPHPGAANHNGGALHFGPDGHLYLSTGDGGGGGDPNENAQNVDALLGKLLRFDPQPGGGHASPSDNPFAGATDGADEVWSYGLRNPFRWSFDRLTGDLTIGDVGQGSWEELDFQSADAGAGRGVNFGWDCREGAHDFSDPSPGLPCPGPFTDPVLEYPNPPSGSAAVTGGYVSRDPDVAELYGRYLYADFYVGEIRSFLPSSPASSDRSEGLTVEGPSAFGEDSCGRLYVASLTGGQVYRLVGSAPTDCSGQLPPPGPPPKPPPGDAKAPTLELDGEARQEVRGKRVRLKVVATADEDSTLTVGGEVGSESGKKRLFDLKTKSRELGPSASQRVRWKVSRRKTRRVRRLIHNGRRISAGLGATAVDDAGNRTPEVTRDVRLILP